MKHGFLLSIFCVLAVAGAGLVLEIIWRREEMTIGDRLRGFVFWPFLLVGNALAGLAVMATIKALGAQPVFDLGSWPAWVRIPFFVLVADFGFYWFHRLQHRFLWRFHSVHHSIANLSAINSYHHWSEPAFVALLQSLPLVLLGFSPGPGSFLILLAVQAQPFLIHSATRLHLGPLGRFVIDGRYHRIHHSLQERHFDKNFGALTPLWDVLFQTVYWPKDEWPKVGVAERREPKNLKDWLTWPLTARPPASGPAWSPQTRRM